MRIGAQIWNSIPYSIKILKRSSFCKRIKELLLNFLWSEDDYVEVSRLTKLFNTLGECQLFHLQVDSPTLTSIHLHDVSCFAYTSGGDLPTRLHSIFTVNNRYKCDQHLVYITIYRCNLYRIVCVLTNKL